jgi:hypothetical protein
MKLVKIKKMPKCQDGGYIQDTTGLGTFLYNQPVEMQLSGTNPIVGGPVDVMATDSTGKRAIIPAFSQQPTLMNGNVKEIPMMKKGGRVKNKSVADFNPHRKEENLTHPIPLNEPSEKDIASTVKEVEPDEANVEAEKDELVMKPDMSGLYKIKGKTHKQGGTHLNLDEGSFIFSNDPDLAIDKEEAEIFDFEEPKSNKPKDNTPAKVLEREVNPKKYNTHVNRLSSKDEDKISKITSALMLEKHQQKIGRVAYLQEAKKAAAIPSFAMGSAPIQNPAMDNYEAREAMYAQKGGPVPYPGGNTLRGRITPTGANNQYDFPVGDPRENNIKALADAWLKVGVDIRGKSAADAQGMMYDWALKNNPGILQTMWSDYGMTSKGIKEGLNTDDLSPESLKRMRSGFTDNMFGVRQFTPQKALKPSIPNAQVVNQAPFTIPNPPFPQAPEQAQPNESIPSLGYEIKGKLTNPQLAHLAAMGLNAMSVKKYYPKREQVDLPEVNLDTINEQPYINDINNQSFQAYQAAASGDPRMSRLNASQIYGRGLDAASRIRGSIQNQNTQIQNQENLTNLQQRTSQVMANTQFDDRYFDQVQATRENFDRERRYANNAVLSQLNQYQSQADALAWGLASVNKYGRRLVTDPKTGKKYYKPVPLFEATQNGINYNADVADLALASGADRVNTADEALQILKQNGINLQDYKQVYAFSSMIKALGQAKNPLYTTNPFLPNQ